MAYLNEATKNIEQQLRLRGGVAARTLTGNVTCDRKTETICFWDPGGANRDVTLGAVGESNGLFHIFKNEADNPENLVIKNAGGSTIVTINQSEWAIVACDGATWQDIPLSAFADILASANAWTGDETHSGTETFSNAAGVTTDTVTERSAGVGVTVDGALIKDAHILDSVGFYDAAAPTKVVRLDAGAVTAGQTRVLAMPDANVTMVADPASYATLALTTNGNGAAKVGIEDAATQITATTVEGALTEIVDTAQALVVDLASTADAAKGAALIGIEGADTYWTGTTQKVANDEIKAAIGGTSSTVRNYSSNSAVADNDDLVVAIGKLDADTALVAEDGVIPSASIKMNTNPTDTDTLTIGADVYEFCTAAGSVADDTRKAVVIGGNAAATLVNLIAAINNTVATPHPTLFRVDGVTPALSRGVENVFGAATGTDLDISPSTTPGSAAIVGDPSIALTDALTAAVGWNYSNLNLAGGAARGHRAASRAKITITTAMIAHGTARFTVQHTVEGFSWRAYTSAGGLVGADVTWPDDTLTESGSVFTLTLPGGVDDLLNTDFIIVESWGTVS